MKRIILLLVIAFSVYFAKSEVIPDRMELDYFATNFSPSFEVTPLMETAVNGSASMQSTYPENILFSSAFILLIGLLLYVQHSNNKLSANFKKLRSEMKD